MNDGLATSASPYLRAHADNPVAWRPWGQAAFDEAARRGVPVLVSIGYSTCHWCHVMARESFSDPAIADVLGAGFVAVKVDREEHPEVDAAYMKAASAFTPNLGWPLTAFATPAGRVFYAGTYFPPTQRGGLPSFRQVLDAVTEAWTERRGEVEDTAARLVAALRDAAVSGTDTDTDTADAPPALDAVAGGAARVVEREDREFGGFAGGEAIETPKFPMAPQLRFLQHPTLASVVPEAAAVARRALAAMRASELFDAVDGGFFRYATRRDWTVPHYERMLTDNAGLIDVALAAGDVDTARRTADFLIEVLQQPSGGFAGAQDSESWIDGERSEGGYYLRDADGRRELDPPALDAKIVTAWNGVAIAALARLGFRLGPEGQPYLDAARRAADAVLEANVADDGTVRRASLDEITSPAAGSLEDTALLGLGLVELAVATGDAAYAVAARAFVDQGMARLADPVADPALRVQGLGIGADPADSDHPSGPGALAAAALRLWFLGAGDEYRAGAEGIARTHGPAALREPLAHGTLLAVAASLAATPRQVLVVGDPHAPIAHVARRVDAGPADVVVLVDEAQRAAFVDAGFTLFEGKSALHGATTAYDCRAFVCRLPVTDPAALTP